MKPLLPTLLDGLRAVLLCRPRTSLAAAGAGTFIALIALYFLILLGIAASDTPMPWQFDAAGVPSVLTDALLTLVAAWLLVEFAQRRDIVWGAAAIVLAATIANAVIVHWPIQHLTAALDDSDHALLATVLDLAGRAWWFVVLTVLARWLAPQRLPRVLAAAVLAYAVSAAAWWWLPSSPLLAPLAANGLTHLPLPPADDGGAAPTPGFDAESVMFQQRALLDAALAKLKAHAPGTIDLYVVAFAGDAEEDVFRNEAEYAEQLFSRRFGADGRVLVLENNAATVATRPLATWTNLHYALDAIAKRMDPAEDILLLYLTSHGSEDHQLLVELDPLPLDQIEPEDLADALKTDPRMRWKVIVVNACYSGGFIDSLRDDSTMVIASARTDRSSFGCGAASDITWFGKAFLVEALNHTTSLRQAFDLARRSIAAWEHEDGEEPSEPQIASSPGIERKLEAWRQHLPAQPAVPFAPAAQAPAAH